MAEQRKKNELRNEFVLSSPEHSSNNTQKEDEKKREEEVEVEEYFIHSFIPSIMFYLHLQPITFCWKF